MIRNHRFYLVSFLQRYKKKCSLALHIQMGLLQFPVVSYNGLPEMGTSTTPPFRKGSSQQKDKKIIGGVNGDIS
jgi:hypothetical protein